LCYFDVKSTSGASLAMTRVLITAFEPYGTWAANASWLCLLELTRQLPASPELTTRLYPVDFNEARKRLAADLEADFDFALHLGQAPGSTALRLEQLAVNVGALPGTPIDETFTLCDDGPVAYACDLPLVEWSRQLRGAGIPTAVSFHAGTYLCNATLYWSRYLAERRELKTRSTFLHLPLETSQVLSGSPIQPSLPAATTAAALRIILAALDRQGTEAA
jgi:pyroglutamyl-peptidase